MTLLLPVVSEGKPVIIGVDGLGGSGKTTFAQEIQRQRDGAWLFHLDDFIHPKKVRYNGDYEEWYCYYNLQWRYEYLLDHIVEPLKNGKAVKQTVELYDKNTDGYLKKEIDIPIESTVIIEGVFLQRAILRDYFDYVIFLDVDKETRLKRVIERDAYIGDREAIIHKYEQRYFPAEETYMRECQPLTVADCIQR